VDLQIAAPDSAVRLLRIELTKDGASGAVVSDAGVLNHPVGMRYYYSRLSEDPYARWKHDSPEDRPFVQLTGSVGPPASIGSRNLMSGFGSDRALAKIATLFLDFGAPQDRDSEYMFGEDLAPYSAELALGLPGTDWAAI
jgi:hypothetical protein